MVYRGYRRQALDFYTSLDIRKKKDKGEQHNYFVEVLLVQGQTPEDKLKTLNECNCCDRHKTNKPERLDSVIKNNVPCQKDYETILCGCDCRHLARLICYNPSVCDICSD